MKREMKNPEELRIVFMGTPEFAVPSLEALVERGYNVVAVVTTPDKPAGRGLKVQESEVKRAAERLGIGTILQPERLRDEEFVGQMRGLEPDLGIVIAFRMLPEVIWQMPALGTFNLHASLLPQYRGAAPINRAIMNGETETGITTFLLNREIDKGAIIGQMRVPIREDDDAGALYDRLMKLGPELVLDSVNRLARGEVSPREQSVCDESELHPAPKIFREDCLIEWNGRGVEIINRIRGLSPYPAAWTNMYKGGKEAGTAKIFRARFEKGDSGERCGSTVSDGRTYLGVRCSDGTVFIEQMQIAGKRRMDIHELLQGLRDVGSYSFE